MVRNILRLEQSRFRISFSPYSTKASSKGGMRAMLNLKVIRSLKEESGVMKNHGMLVFLE